MRRDDLADLATFLAVAEERSFTRAAARLGLTQSTLSHAVRAFDERLGLRLFNRITRSVPLTEAGERLLRAAKPGVEAIELELAALSEQRGKPAGTVRITTSAHAYGTILWPALRRLLPEQPGLQVEVTVEPRFVDVVAGRFDAGSRLEEAVERDMIAVRIGPDLRWIVVGAPSYLATCPALAMLVSASPWTSTAPATIRSRAAAGPATSSAIAGPTTSSQGRERTTHFNRPPTAGSALGTGSSKVSPGEQDGLWPRPLSAGDAPPVRQADAGARPNASAGWCVDRRLPFRAPARRRCGSHTRFSNEGCLHAFPDCSNLHPGRLDGLRRRGLRAGRHHRDRAG